MENDGQPRNQPFDGDDNPYTEDTSSNRALEENLKSRSTWLRFVFMIVFVLIYGVTRIVLGAVVILQFLWVLFTAETNPRLLHLGASLATYTYQILRYLTYNTEERPFPFDLDWPNA
jgi:multisubunit Na+/H+ antiporter MnhE subunit